MVDYLEDDRFDVCLSHDHPNHTWGLAYVWSIFWRKHTREAMAREGRVDAGSVFAALGEAEPKVRVHTDK